MSAHASLARALLVATLASASAGAQDDPYERRGFTGAVGAGVSSAGVSCVPQCEADRQNGPALFIRVGAHVSPEFSLGLEGTLFRATVKAMSPAGTWSLSWLTLSTVWYPSSDDDFFLKLGLGVAVVRVDTPSWVRAELERMGYRIETWNKTSGPINAVFIDRAQGSLWGGSSDFGEDYGIAW